MKKNKNGRKISAWDMHQIAKNSTEKRGDKFLLEALEVCKKSAELGYYYAEYENGLSTLELMQLGNLGYKFTINHNRSVTIRWGDVKEPKKK